MLAIRLEAEQLLELTVTLIGSKPRYVTNTQRVVLNEKRESKVLVFTKIIAWKVVISQKGALITPA